MGKTYKGFRSRKRAKAYADKSSKRRIMKRPDKDLKSRLPRSKYIVAEYW